jgi:formylglycine-generating enzyme required for sulfatase activity
MNVNWNDAKKYVSWLSRKTGKHYRLLTEAEWEYAARAGKTTPFNTGHTITPNQANFDGDYTYKGVDRKRTIAVGSFSPNRFGLYDMHGNVWERVEDCWVNNYQGAPSNGSAHKSGGDCSRRVLRGGSWNSYPWHMRAAYRSKNSSTGRYSNLGFRIARTL